MLGRKASYTLCKNCASRELQSHTIGSGVQLDLLDVPTVGQNVVAAHPLPVVLAGPPEKGVNEGVVQERAEFRSSTNGDHLDVGLTQPF